NGWTLLSGTAGPSARSGAAVAFDPLLGEDVLFGGRSGVPLGDTWALRGTNWTRLTETTAPSPRNGAAMAWDPVGGYLLLFGGFSAMGYQSDSWEFVSGHWALLAPSMEPSPRADAALALDPTGGRLVLFGGTNGGPLGDTWAFSAGNWTPVNTTSSPSPRSDAVFTDDPEAGAAVLFSGRDSGPLNDTWEFHDGGWTEVTPTSSPGSRAGAAGAFDITDGYLVVYGGNGSGRLADTWSFRNSTWSALAPPFHPPAFSDAAVTFDPTSGSLIAFGGYSNSTVLGATWGFRAAPNGSSKYNWSEVHSTREPTDRTQAGFAFDAADGAVVMFGGQNQSGTSNATDYYNDTWTYRAGVWTQHNLTPSPSPRRGTMLTYDPAVGALVLFGGSNGSSYFNDTWTYRHGVWTPIPTAVAPTPRRSAGFAFDPQLGGILLFGGHNASGGARGFYTVFNDTWLWTAAGWSQISGGSSPEPRAEPLMTFDPTDGFLLLYGGYHQNGTAFDEQELDSTWVFENRTWTNITARVGIPPSPRDGSGFVFDPATGYILAFAGDDNRLTAVPSIWEFQLGHWKLNCNNCAAPTWAADHAVYDEADGYLITQGSQKGVPPVGEGPRLQSLAPDAGPPGKTQRTWAWNATPFLSVTASPIATDLGRPVALTGWLGAGTPPWSLTWAVHGRPSVSGPVDVATFSSVGTIKIFANASAPGSNQTRSTLTVVVNSTPRASLLLTPSFTPEGSPVTITIGGRLGTSPLALLLAGLPPGCPASGSQSLVCSPSSPGVYNVTLNVTDQLGAVGWSNATLVVNATVVTGPGRFASLETYVALFGPAAIAVPTAIYLVLRFRHAPPKRGAPAAVPPPTPPATSPPSPPSGSD
ncbi:MAG: hypothetical protein L3K05_01035, partial [Thermoplasmata archaeon]|nr:hypothetical protein [Thermoplasmata archaeon]